jgi:hypothetical protein
MSFKMSVQKLAIERGIIPSNVKLEKVVQAYGELFMETYEWAEKYGLSDGFVDSVYKRGKKNGERFKEKFNLSGTPKDAAFALIAGHKLFGIKSRIAENSKAKAVIRVSDCPWKELFTPRACDILGNIEKGACDAISQGLSYAITKKLTDKDDICEFVVERSKEAGK